MADQQNRPVFLERANYRRRRVADAARAVPILGGVLVMLPLLWPEGSEEQSIGTPAAFLFVFGIWVVMIASAALMARWLKQYQKEG